jgi:hypothetical protein
LPTLTVLWRRGGVVTQGSAKPRTPVQFWSSPPHDHVPESGSWESLSYFLAPVSHLYTV